MMTLFFNIFDSVVVGLAVFMIIMLAKRMLER